MLLSDERPKLNVSLQNFKKFLQKNLESENILRNRWNLWAKSFFQIVYLAHQSLHGTGSVFSFSEVQNKYVKWTISKMLCLKISSNRFLDIQSILNVAFNSSCAQKQFDSEYSLCSIHGKTIFLKPTSRFYTWLSVQDVNSCFSRNPMEVFRQRFVTTTLQMCVLLQHFRQNQSLLSNPSVLIHSLLPNSTTSGTQIVSSSFHIVRPDPKNLSILKLLKVPECL